MRKIPLLVAFATLFSTLQAEELPVTQFQLRYTQPHPGQIPVKELQKIVVKRGKETIPLSLDSSTPHYYSSDDIVAVAEAIIRYLNDKGISGVAVRVASDEIDEEGRDMRVPGQTELTLNISTAVVGEMHTIGGDKLTAVDAKRHARILRHSPVQEGDLLLGDQLENYLCYLNRHPHRRVDAEVHGLEQSDQVGLDFLVTDDKPWRLYATGSTTGNPEIGKWQETVGFVHTNLTEHDDIFNFAYTTDTFNSFYSVSGSYDAPLFVDHIRWKIYGYNAKFSSTQIGIRAAEFTGRQTNINGQLTFNIFQDRDFFIDLFAGLNFMHVKTANELLPYTGAGLLNFASPTAGFTLQCFKNSYRLYLTANAQASGNSLSSSRANIDNLGRVDTSKHWTILSANGFFSFYFDPHELAHEFATLFEGQYAFNYRVIPELKEVVGGFYTVRGYPLAVNSGDNAFVGKFEYLFHIPYALGIYRESTKTFTGKSFRAFPEYPGGRTDWDLLVRVFSDVGRSVNNRRVAITEINSTLVSGGLGLEFLLRDNLSLRGDWAMALKRIPGISEPTTVKRGHQVFYFVGTIAY